MNTFRRISSVLGAMLLAALLTLLTQVGGAVYLLSLALQAGFRRRLTLRWQRRLAHAAVFILLYAGVSFGILPLLARSAGRVPLPVMTSGHLAPLRAWTWVMNRHYVRPELKQAALEAAHALDQRFPGSRVHYLDANFPLFDGFPLIPHLSHDDGKKLDLSFCYALAQTGEATHRSPSWLGYGVCEDALPGEENRPALCAARGYWQYSLLRSWVGKGDSDLRFDKARTKSLIEALVQQPAIGKLFIEPHLKTRLQLHHPKVRFHGCQAVRHDDHIHVQLR